MSVMGKGDSVKIPPKSEKDEDDIEALVSRWSVARVLGLKYHWGCS